MDDGAGVRRTVSATDICFNCNQRGHWYKDCPSRTATRSQPSLPGADTPVAVDSHNLPVVQCPSCGGICALRTSKTAKNPDRKFYSCSCDPQGKLSFFAWLDTISSLGSEVPFCSCGAGRCSVATKTTGPNVGRRYFACRVPKGQGACPFFQWEDDKLNGTLDNGVGESKHSDPFSTRNDQEVTCTINVDLDNGEHANAAQSKGNNCKVSHTTYVDSSSRKHTNVPQSKENDYEVTRTVNVDLGEGKHNDRLSSARSCEVTHTIYVDLGRDKHAKDPQPEGRGCEVTDGVNVDLSEDKHVTSLMSAESYEVTPTINADLERCKRDNAPKCKENGNKVTHIVNDVLVEDKFANSPPSAGNKHEVTHTLGGDKHADTPQYNFEGTHTVNVDLGEGKYGSSPPSAELGHTVPVDLVFEHSKRMRSDLPMMSNDLHSREYNLGYAHSKRMRKDLSMMGNQHYIPFAEVNLPPADSSKHSEPSEISSPSGNHSNLQFVMPKISNSLDLVDVGIVQNGDSCISIMNKASRGSCLSPSKLEFSRQIYATRDTVTGDLIVLIHEIFGFHAVGWLGRLVFLPRGFMTLPPPKPFFYGISPSFSAITVPEPMEQSDTAGLIVRAQSPHTQHEKQCVTNRDSQLIRDHKETLVQQQTVESFRINLVTLLKSMNPQDHKYMELVANPILDSLDHLSADNSYLRNRVEEFIRCASALAQAACTSEIEPSSEDLTDQYNNEKARLGEVIGEHAEAVDAFKASKEVCSLLRKEASRLKKMLVQIETLLAGSELETLKLKARAQETCEAKKKCQISLQSIKEELKVRQRKEDELLVVKEAFKKAKKQLL